jgi:thymidylate synthase (FAD)
MFAKLIDSMGTDLTVVNAARVSFNNMSDELTTRDVKLIRYLASHGHWTPFGHPQITMHVKAPIFVRTQCFKHKIGFVENEISRRYVYSEPTFYKPDIWRQQAENVKQGSLTTSVPYPSYIDQEYNKLLEHALITYKTMLEKGVAPEQARMVLPQSMYTEWYWTGSLLAYSRFYKLRKHPGAQAEISELAGIIGPIIGELFPFSWEELLQSA